MLSLASIFSPCKCNTPSAHKLKMFTTHMNITKIEMRDKLGTEVKVKK